MKTAKTRISLGKGLRLFRAFYRSPEGVQKMADAWYVEFRDDRGRVRRLPAFTDQQQSAELAYKLRKLVAWKVSGELPDAETSRWIDAMPDRLRDKLAEIGLLDARRVAASKPLSEHLDDWKADLLAKGVTAQHANDTFNRAKRVIDDCGFQLWTAISASRISAYLDELRKDTGNKKGVSIQTFNFYLQAVKQFCKWMVKDRRAVESPLNHLSGMNVKTDRRHDRRAFSLNELIELLRATGNGPERGGSTALNRKMLYRLAAESGLRAGELRSLTRASFVLEGDEPTVTVEAAYAKSRRPDTLPLKTETAGELVQFLAGKMPAALAFTMPKPDRLVKVLRADLENARVAWINSAGIDNAERERRANSSFLNYRDDAGRVLDFHAFRHTFITNLGDAGVHPKTAQALARHSTIKLTMDRYTHVRRPQMADALASLPDLSVANRAETMRATGTDDASATDPKSTENHLARYLAHFDGSNGNGRQHDSTNLQSNEKAEENRNPCENRGLCEENGEGGIQIEMTRKMWQALKL